MKLMKDKEMNLSRPPVSRMVATTLSFRHQRVLCGKAFLRQTAKQLILCDFYSYKILNGMNGAEL